MRKVAIVTPYYQEPPEVIARCLDSVAAQTVSAEHYVVADGHPQTWIEKRPVRHLALDRGHANYGNTPRAIGALLAMAEGHDVIAFLDADNWLEPDHLEHCIAVHDRAGDDCDYVLAKRHMRRPDGSILEIAEQPGLFEGDTSCFVFFPGAFHMIPLWGTMPQEISAITDRVFFTALKAADMKGRYAAKKTVNYVTLFEGAYVMAGETPPENGKWIDLDSILEWMNGLEGRDKEIAERRCGVPFET